MQTAFAVARPGSTVGFVGVPHGVELPVRRMFQKNVGLAGGMAPVRRYLPELLELVQAGAIDPGLVFDATLPLDEVAEGYRAMDEREAIKVLIQPCDRPRDQRAVVLDIGSVLEVIDDAVFPEPFERRHGLAPGAVDAARDAARRRRHRRDRHGRGPGDLAARARARRGRHRRAGRGLLALVRRHPGP